MWRILLQCISFINVIKKNHSIYKSFIPFIYNVIFNNESLLVSPKHPLKSCQFWNPLHRYNDNFLSVSKEIAIIPQKNCMVHPKSCKSEERVWMAEFPNSTGEIVPSFQYRLWLVYSNASMQMSWSRGIYFRLIQNGGALAWRLSLSNVEGSVCWE